METIEIIGLIILIIVVMEFATFLVYGGFVTKETEEVFMNLDKSKLRLNQFDPTILSTNPYIANVPFSLFSKYHINGIGTIPRWSKLHKKIKHYFAVAIINQMN